MSNKKTKETNSQTDNKAIASIGMSYNYPGAGDFKQYGSIPRLIESDGELVRCLRAGEQKALAILYERYAGLVHSVAYKILHNRQEAEDLTQDISVTFWKQDRFDPNSLSSASWQCCRGILFKKL